MCSVGFAGSGISSNWVKGGTASISEPALRRGRESTGSGSRRETASSPGRWSSVVAGLDLPPGRRTGRKRVHELHQEILGLSSVENSSRKVRRAGPREVVADRFVAQGAPGPREALAVADPEAL